MSKIIKIGQLFLNLIANNMSGCFFLKHGVYLNPEVHFRLYGQYLEKSIWHHNSAADRSITTKFGRQM